LRAAPPTPLNINDPLDDAADPTIDETSTNDSAGNTLINPIDIDQQEADTSISFSKRKLNVIASDEEINIYGDPIPLSTKPSSTTSDRPAKKKTSSLPRSRSKNTSSTHSSQPRASTSTKLTPTLIAHEIQGSINSLASAVRESGLTDPVAKLRQEAIHYVSDVDDNLSVPDKIDLIDLFRKDYTAVQAYTALLKNDLLRKQWLEKQLQELKD
jgi:hypothetical protein